MSYQFQPIGEVEKLDEVPETANAIVEVDGEIKRVPGSGLGGAAGSGFVVVHITHETSLSDENTVTADASFADIKAKLQANEIVIAAVARHMQIDISGVINIYENYSCFVELEDYYIEFLHGNVTYIWNDSDEISVSFGK